MPIQSRMFSTISVTGFDAHLKFYFDPASFLFSPTASFEVTSLRRRERREEGEGEG